MNENVAISASALEDLNGRYLLFYIDDVLYGVSLALVLEIIQIQTITHLPGVAPHIKGIVNLRGRVVPVIDVRLKLNLPERPYDDKTCIVVLDIHGMHIGLIVDSVSEVVTVSNEQLSAPPSTGDMSTRFLASVSELGNKVALNIDFESFFQNDIGIIRAQ